MYNKEIYITFTNSKRHINITFADYDTISNYQQR